MVIESTSEDAPESPPKGGADQVFAPTSQTATDFPGDENEPPAHSLLLASSQKTAFTSPFGPSLPNALKVSSLEEYEATLLADVPFMELNEPAKKKVSPSAQPALIFPPASVEPNLVNEPSAALDKRVEVDGSNESEVELSNKSSPANVPARPTWPIRSKSTLGRAAYARAGTRIRK